LASNLGDHHAARAYYEDALTIFQELGDRRTEAGYVGNIGRVSTKLGDYTQARSRLEEALAITRELGDRRSEGFWIGSLGEAAFQIGDYEEARGRFDEALSIARELGDRRAEYDWLGDLGGIACKLGDHVEAGGRYREALTIAGDLGRPDDLLLESCAELLVALDRYRDATELLGAAGAITALSRRRPAVSERSRHEACMAACRDHQSKQGFEQAFRRGSATDWASARARAFEFLALS
jgi:tetratricopeptide (TPR) repeat protein